MSAISFTIPRDFGFVIAMGSVAPVAIGKARKASGITYPVMYPAEERLKDPTVMKYQCVQRAHQNTLENLPFYLTLLLTSGLVYPRAAAICGGIYLAGRVAYTSGYHTGDAKKRMNGVFGYIGLLGLLGMSCKNIYDIVTSGL